LAQEYGDFLHPVLQSIFQCAAEQLSAQQWGAAAGSSEQQQLRQLQLLVSGGLLRLQEPFVGTTTELMLAWTEDGHSVSQLANARIKGMLEQLLGQVQATSMELAAQAVYNRARNSPSAQTAEAVLQQEVGLNLEKANLTLFSTTPGPGSIPAALCKVNLSVYMSELLWEGNVSELDQTWYLAKV
jgi:hypothetical protein